MLVSSDNIKRGGFNSRTPGGVRLDGHITGAIEQRFNSRTPGGVRLIPGTPQLLIGHVSIHAPREGCDLLMSRDASKEQ